MVVLYEIPISHKIPHGVGIHCVARDTGRPKGAGLCPGSDVGRPSGSYVLAAVKDNLLQVRAKF